jgi:molybdopterin molybdotransferase
VIVSSPADGPSHVDAGELVPLATYRRDVLTAIRPLEPIELGLLEAHGCVLSTDVAAEVDIPGFDNSAMDGYALRAAESAAGAELQVIGELAAGADQAVEVGPEETVRIMTGAPLPAGADAVIPWEATDEADGRLRLSGRVEPGLNVRRAGEDVRAGEVVLRAGRRLGAADVSMLAAVGRASVPVHPRPRVVVLSTGDELVEPDAPLAPGKVRDSNSYMLTALAREAGATAYRQRTVRDDRHALIDAIEGALTHGDLLVTSGGVSAGRYDLVKMVLGQLGDVRFTKVGMQPGMPQVFGFIDDVPCFGLPGNPVSAYVSFEVFVRPALRRLQSRRDVNRPRVTATLEEPARSPEHKVSFLRVRLSRDQAGAWRARPTGPQGSGILRSVVEADGLAEIPPDRTRVEAGDRVVVHVLVDAP